MYEFITPRKRLNIVILRTEDFSEDLYKYVKDFLVMLIENHGIKSIMAGGDRKDTIYRIFCELAVEYPRYNFSILLSNDELAYEDSDVPGVQIFALDPEIAYGSARDPAGKRDNALLQVADILICRRGSIYDNDSVTLKEFNPNLKIIPF